MEYKQIKTAKNILNDVIGKCRVPLNLQMFAESCYKTKIGTLDAYEKCKCLNKYDGTYRVCYKVTGTSTYKTGFVKCAGGLEW